MEIIEEHKLAVFADELAAVLPVDLPRRDEVIRKGARHLELIAEANERFNLTRITSPRDAAIKHVYDSVAAWRFFGEAGSVLDVGTGAGFPGIPLAIVLPEVKFTLAESIQKKARFVDEAVDELGLRNATVTAERAEAVAAALKADLITARAVAPLERLLPLFAKALRQGARLLLYKGPDVGAELGVLSRFHVTAEEVMRYELPDEMGTRVLLEVRARRGER